MGWCCCTAPAVAVDEDETISGKQEKLGKQEKVRLHSGQFSDSPERETKLKTKGKRRVGTGMYEDEDEDLSSSQNTHADVASAGSAAQDPATATVAASSAASASAVAVASAEEEEAAAAAKAAAAAAAATAEEEARAVAAAAAEAAEAAAAAEAARVAEAQAHAAKLNSALASRIASTKPKTRAQVMHTAAALEMNDGAAFDAFVKWEDNVQRAAAAILGKVPKKKITSKKRAAEGNLFTLLAMEEQTRNSAFVAALQTQSLSQPLQGKALRFARACGPAIAPPSPRPVCLPSSCLPPRFEIASPPAALPQGVRYAVRQRAQQADAPTTVDAARGGPARVFLPLLAQPAPRPRQSGPTRWLRLISSAVDVVPSGA